MYNKSILIGRLTAEPELKKTNSGVYVTGFTIAVDRRFKQDGERKADFLSIVAWRQQAEFVCKFLHKGDPIGIEGSIQTRQYEDKQGNKRTATEIQADNVFFVSGKGEKVLQGNTVPTDYEEVETDEDLPF